MPNNPFYQNRRTDPMVMSGKGSHMTFRVVENIEGSTAKYLLMSEN